MKPRSKPRPTPLVSVKGQLFRVADGTHVSNAGLELERAARAWLDESDYDPAGRTMISTEMRLARALRRWIELTGRL